MKRFAWALALAACHRAPPPVPAPPDAAQRRERTPRTQAEFSTDPSTLSLHNLDSQIEGQGLLAKGRHDPGAYSMLTMLLLRRGALTGRIADYEKAADAAQALMKLAPKQPGAWEAKAQVDSTFHRFADALSALDEASRLGGTRDSIEPARIAIEEAQGTNPEVVFAYRQKAAQAFPSITNLMLLAVAEADRGELAKAKQHFGDAQDHYRDVSPFPLATLYFQEGLVEQRAGSPARARALFAAAHERLPEYAQATSHLAAALAMTGDRQAATTLLDPLTDADDPEYEGQLATILDDNEGQRAKEVRKDASTRYEALLKKYPLAFADHAARFYLSGPKEQQNAERALELARTNAKNRTTLEAERLLIDAAIAAGDPTLACATADAMTKETRPLPPEALVSEARAFTACGQKERAAACLASIATPP